MSETANPAKTINDGGPAFPRPYGEAKTCQDSYSTQWGYNKPQEGMSLRDYFAGIVLQALITKLPVVDQGGHFGHPVDDIDEYTRNIVDSSYDVADAMLARREEDFQS